MRKLYTLLILLFLGSVAWGQGVLFERGIYEPAIQGFYNYNGISDPTVVQQWNDHWLVLGNERDCYNNSLHQFSTSGELVFDSLLFNRDLYRSIASYTAVCEAYSSLYASGKAFDADDYPSEWARGFIDKIDSVGVTTEVLMDTSYNAGFIDMDVADGAIYVLAGKGPDIPYIITSTSIVKYDISGAKLADIVIDNEAIAVRSLGNTIVVFYEDSFVVYDKALQNQLTTAYTITDFADVLHEVDEELMVLTTDAVLVLDTGYIITDSLLLPQGFEAEYFDSSPSGFLAVYGMSNGDGQVLVIDQTGSIVNTFGIDVSCADVSNIALNDSVISLIGQQLINGSNRGFIKTYSYNGASSNETDELELIDIQLFVDTYSVISTTQIGPTQWAYYFNMDYHIDFTVTNNGLDTINYFELMSDQYGGVNCSKGFKRWVFDSITILPSNTENYTVSDFRHWASSRDSVIISFEFTLRSIDKGVFNGQCPVTQLVLDVHDKTLPETNIKIYPNPSTGIYHIGDASAGSTIMVQDLQGRVVLTAQVHDKTTIDLNAQPQGVYLYTVTDTDGRSLAAGKLIKQ